MSSLVLSDAARQRPEDGGLPGAPLAVIRHSAPLRICDLRHPFTRPPEAEDLAHADLQFAFLTGHVVRLCGTWNRRLADLVAAYFAFVRDEVARRSTDLAARTGELAGLVEPDHWAFLAPMPLPRAHLPPLGETPPFATDDFVAADLAFWTGCGFLALFAGGGTEFGARLRARRTLEERGVTTRVIGPGADALDRTLREIGPPFTDFTDRDALPASPFRGTGLPRPA